MLHPWNKARGLARELLPTRIKQVAARGMTRVRPGDDAGRRGGRTESSETSQWTAVTSESLQKFFDNLCADGSIERAVIDLTRELLAAEDRRHARAILQTLQRYPDLRPIADLGLAISAITEPMPDTAWTLFNRNDLALITAHVPLEYFRFGFGWQPEQTSESLDRVLRGEVPINIGAQAWYEIAYAAFAAGCTDVATRALDRVERAAATAPAARRDAVLRRVSRVRDWIARAQRAGENAAVPAGEVPFALVGYDHPSTGGASTDIADPMQTLVVLAHLMRHDGVYFSGRPALCDAAADLAPQLRRDNHIAHAVPRIVSLQVVERDASRFADLPDGTWIVISEWFTRPLAGKHYDIPMNARLRPIFVGFHITVAALRTPGTIEYLRRYAPIGCIDWDTAFLLHAAGIPAFFSGGLAATSDIMFEPAKTRSTSRVYVDVDTDARGERRTHLTAAVQRRPLGANLLEAANLFRGYRDAANHVVTKDLRTYLALRGLGVSTQLRSRDPHRARVTDHVSLSDEAFADMSAQTSRKLAAVLGAIVDGRTEDEVYRVWREACAADVEATEERLRNPGPGPKLSFDLNAVCTSILEHSVTVERTQSAGEGPEINVEFSLDANYKHQLDIVLDSVVAHTERPVRAFVLCRGHGHDDFARMARLFRTVSFVWLPTDSVDYGRISDMNKWVTPATMDRTILPALLPEVDRMIHFDLDALCLADLGELYDVDLDGAAIASTREPQPKFVSGFETYRWSANRLRSEGSPDVARDFTIRSHAKDKFDFDIFNAGVMVMDLAKMRADDFCGRYLPYVQHYGLNGQIVLNTYTGNTAKYVDARWNQLVRIEVLNDPKIAHWAGPMKPWKSDLYVAGRELWDEGERRFAVRAKRAGLS